MSDEAKILIEDVGGDFGFRLKWKYLPHWADVEVYEIVSRDADGNPGFTPRDGPTSHHAPDISMTDPDLKGYVKWDGCCEFDLGSHHFCGARDLIKHFALLKHIYLRAGELSGHNHTEDPWPTAKGKPELPTT